MSTARIKSGASGARIAEKLLYFFSKGKAEGTPGRRDLLGNKGAGCIEMSLLGVPVPPGFIISTRACKLFYRNEGKAPPRVDRQLGKYIRRVEKATGRGFGDPDNPLLVSVRSGAAVSMPGMMDTILNVGLNDRTVAGLAKKTSNPRFAWDCYRRLIVMFASTVKGVDKNKFERVLDHYKKKKSVTADSELATEDVRALVEEYKTIYRREVGEPFPQDVMVQLKESRDAVFRSWMNKRAIEYRRLYHLADDMGTAVTVQAMVFGNMGENSGTGVGFTRDPATGENTFYGEFLVNAQGEDVVAGIRTPLPIASLRQKIAQAYRELYLTTKRLETFYRDVQDFEFTIEEGKLYLLQTRTGKRTGFAALRIAVEMAQEGIITPEEAVRRVSAEHLQMILHPIFDPVRRREFKAIAKGLNASPGAASGMVVFDPDRVVELTEKKGQRCILVRPETSADDVHGMARARGILTCKGGFTSHAAVVARQMGKPSVVGCEEIRVDEEQGTFTARGIVIREGEYVSIDGNTGEVLQGDVPLRDSEIIQVLRGKLRPEDSWVFAYYSTLMTWVDRFRRLRVRANADVPVDALLAFQLGSEGIGLCRTEHMFFAEDRLPVVRRMIMATTREDRKAALEKLRKMQIEDFAGLFESMQGRPVTIRLLDPPLHEFLPPQAEIEAEIRKLAGQNGRRLAELKRLQERARDLHEFNPMMGHRGCRLGITFPEITEMQAEAIFEAAIRVAKKHGRAPAPEIMIPVVSLVSEFRHQRELIDTSAARVFIRNRMKLPYKVGTMIETPRAVLVAGQMAREAEFFSFGTNDLTQMTFAFSRDDAGKFLVEYTNLKLLEDDPFVTLDQEGVGELIKLAVERSRRVNPEFKIGLCGEQGGEERSVKFCHKAGLNYVSCSPFRIPVARLAAAHAALEEGTPS
jgi:pyruvate,orthophosphate dikinase